MRPIGSIAFGSGGFALALLAGTALCSAQTAVSRQITTEPVETTVTQGPYGTIVTRRVLDPAPDPGAPAFVRGGVASTVGQGVYEETLAPPLPVATTTIPRRVVTHHVSTPRVHAHVEHPTTSGLATRTIVRTVAPPPGPLVLSPGQRHVIYRTIVHRDVYPQVASPPPPPVFAETDLVAPPSVYPLRPVYPADVDYGQGYGYRDAGYHYRYPYRWDGVPLVPGARLPPSIPLVGVPPDVVAEVPTLAPYAYAYVDNRVYLVDPVTAIIAAEITP